MPHAAPAHGPDLSPNGLPTTNPLLAAAGWIVIVAVVAFAMFLAGPIGALVAGEEPESDSGDSIETMMARIQGRYLVGAGEQVGSEMLFAQGAELLDIGGPPMRLRFAALAGEMAGPEEASARLDTFEELVEGENFELSEADARTLAILRSLFDGPNGAREEEDGETASMRPAPMEQLTEEDQAYLVERLDWFGELALAPKGSPPDVREAAIEPARRSFGIIIASAIGGISLAGVGLIGLIAMLVLGVQKLLRSRVGPSGIGHGVWVETFAVWLVLFYLFQILAGLAGLADERLGFPAILIGFFASLAALGWPVIRGVPFGVLREQIGWTMGDGLIKEFACGLLGYAMALPILAVGVLLTLGFMAIGESMQGPLSPLESPSTPAHPIVESVNSGRIMELVGIFLLASVAAPIVEETMFRGVLYRHLRDASRGMGFLLSVLLSTLIGAFIFAAVHPQGWQAIPALGSLAVAFTLMREWRGTLIPAMIMHGISNGIVLGLLTALVSV